MSLVVIGLEHSKAPFELLERVTVADADVGKVLSELSALENVQEVALVSTCLRTEIYAVVDRFHDAVDDITTLFAQRAQSDRADIDEHQLVYFDRGVATHLFRVASGLESAVPGETEVLGQVRRSLERSSEEGTVGPVLTNLFTHSIHAGRKVRVDTAIARGTTSFSYAAVELAAAHLQGDLSGESVVVLGAGALGAGTVAALVDERRTDHPREVVVINRTEHRAQEILAGLESTVPIRVAQMEELSVELQHARLCISAVETEIPLITEEHVAQREGAPLLIVDLGMPRNVERSVGDHGDVVLLDISDLRSAVEQAMDERRSEITAAEAVVAKEVDHYLEDQRGRGAAPIVVALRERYEAIRVSELERRSGDLASLSPEQRDAVDALTKSLLAKLVHEPTMALKEGVGTSRGERLVEAARLLFGL